jgi:hypothetical protein
MDGRSWIVETSFGFSCACRTELFVRDSDANKLNIVHLSNLKYTTFFSRVLHSEIIMEANEINNRSIMVVFRRGIK